jgi:SAM-dependent methyltransferase
VTDEYAAIADVYDLWSADMTADVPFYVSEAAAATPGPILEVGVGTGRVAMAVARAGVDVVGIDISPSMLDRARRRIADAGLSSRIELVAADMRDFDLGRTFTVAVLPYRVFAHALTTDEQVATLQSLRRHLAPGGRLVLNIPVPRLGDLLSADGLRHEGRFTLDDGTTAVLWRQTDYEPGTQLLHFRFVVDHLDEDGVVVRRVHGQSTVRQSSPGEIQHALARTGFAIADEWGWFDRRAMDGHALEYVVAATRADRWTRGG